MGTTTFIVISNASPILIAYIEICTNPDTNVRSHKHTNAIKAHRLNQNHMHALNDDNKIFRVQFLNATNSILQAIRIINNDAITR